ncbi:hypothetical protein AB8O38_03525 [Saccharomonospora xinjiangensis]
MTCTVLHAEAEDHPGHRAHSATEIRVEPCRHLTLGARRSEPTR